MASNNKPGPINGPFDEAFLQTLMGRLHLQPPSNSHLSQSLQDLLEGFNSSDEGDEEELDELDPNPGNSKTHLAKEEAKLERELIRIVHGGDAVETLKPNSGQSVSVIGHSICVANHEEAGSGYRVWEWHGHLMIYDDEEGFSPNTCTGTTSRGSRRRSR
ncbi:hypothetical protein QJS10_CPB14g01480 [Acorus calamus]|uniref:Uncharacterized protein n=1 Tax=Acorus calamus TaxID=4465 RepID=A0AAV9DCF6_ACOCL|nr:hypothetical protein QJS10_CPB14g01480 [Acorus calamus]